MQYRFEFRPYRRQFKRTLQTSHGSWDAEDIILRLTDQSERAAWERLRPWVGLALKLGTLDFCSQLPVAITDETIFSIPADLTACQFGFESAGKL